MGTGVIVPISYFTAAARLSGGYSGLWASEILVMVPSQISVREKFCEAKASLYDGSYPPREWFGKSVNVH